MTNDFSRMFASQQPAAESVPADNKQKPSRTFATMFGEESTPRTTPVPPPTPPMFPPARIARFERPDDITNWRRDLSDKVREHVELVETLVRTNCNIVLQAESALADLQQEVVTYVEKRGGLTRLFRQQPTVSQMVEHVRTSLDRLTASLSGARTPDPFKVVEVERMLEQASYLNDQLAKAGRELESMRELCADDIERDLLNKRCATLYAQQQLVALGSHQVRDIAIDVRNRTARVDDLLTATIPLCRKLCLDVLDGTAQPTTIRKKTNG